MTDATDISEQVERIEEIIEQLEDGEVSLERAEELHTEGKAILAELENALDIGDGEIIERD